jgi:hypothetical protein
MRVGQCLHAAQALRQAVLLIVALWLGGRNGASFMALMRASAVTRISNSHLG